MSRAYGNINWCPYKPGWTPRPPCESKTFEPKTDSHKTHKTHKKTSGFFKLQNQQGRLDADRFDQPRNTRNTRKKQGERGRHYLTDASKTKIHDVKPKKDLVLQNEKLNDIRKPFAVFRVFRVFRGYMVTEWCN